MDLHLTSEQTLLRDSAVKFIQAAGPKVARAFREQLERVKPTPKIPEWERIANEIRLITERVVHGDLTVAQATRELDARTDRILEKRRWMLARENAP